MKVLLAGLIDLVLLVSQARAGDDSNDANQSFMEEVIQAIEDKMDERIAGAKEGKKELMAILEGKVVESLGRIEGKVDQVVKKQLFVQLCVMQNPCSEHGTCTIVNGTYKCMCDVGYEGDHCEEKGPCYNVTCQYGGICVSNLSDNSYKCECIYPWNGKHCEIIGPCAEKLPRYFPYKPRCDENGYFARLQRKNKLVFCVTRDKGLPILRYRPRQGSVVTESCKCAQDEAAAGRGLFDNDPTGPIARRFRCARDGSYT